MRSSTFHRSAQPVVNLCTNPSFEIASGTVDVWKNLATNPSFESVTASSTTVRTNLYTPHTSNYWGGIYGTGATRTITYEASATAAIGTGVVRITATASATDGTGPRIDDFNTTTLLPSTTYTYSRYVKSSVARTVSYQPVMQGGTVVALAGNPSVSLTANVWTRVSNTFTTLADTTGVNWRHNFGGGPIQSGEVIEFSNPLIEQTDQLRPFFSGATADALGWDYGWTGTANASTSTAKAGVVAVNTNLAANPSFETAMTGTNTVRTNLCTNPSAEVDASGWSTVNGGTGATVTSSTDRAYLGTRSVKYTYGDATTSDSGPSFGTTPVLAGVTYTASVYVYLPASIGSGVRVGAWGSGLTDTYRGAIITTTGAWTRISNTVTAARDGNISFGVFKTVSGTVTGAVLYLDAALIEQTDQLRPYFDGDTPDALGFDYGWSGTANSSASTAKAATVAVRTNLLPNPSAETNAANTQIAGAGVVITRDTTETRPGGTASFKVVADGTSTGQGIQLLGGNVGAGTYSGSFWIKGTAGAVIYANFRITGGGAGDTFTVGGDVTLTGDWQQLTVNPMTTTATGSISLMARSRNQVAVTFYVDQGIVEAASVPGAYFDGSTPSTGDFHYAWTGTANASTSEQRGVAVANTGLANYAYRVLSYEWASSSSTSIRGIPSGTSLVSEGWILAGGGGGAGLGMTGFGVTLQAGKTYTVSVTCRLTAAQTTSSSTARRIQASWNNANTWTGAGATQTSQAANSAGSTRLTLTFTIAADAIWSAIRLGVGSGTGAGDVWWDDLVIVEGTYTGSYFDGTLPSSGDYHYVWQGAAHASASERRAVHVPYAASTHGTSYPHRIQDADGTMAVRSISDITGGGWTLLHSTIPLTTGSTYTLLTRFRATTGRSMSVFLDGSASAGWTGTATGAWQTASVTQVAGAVTNSYGGVRITDRQAGDYIDIDYIAVIPGTYTGSYFDGSTVSTDADLTYLWEGVAHASASVLRGTGVAGVAQFGGRSTVQSSQWSNGGSKSIRIIPTLDAASSAYGAIPIETTTSLVLGKTYTVLAKCRLAAPQTGTLYDRARRIYYGSASVVVQSEQAPNTAGVHDVRLTFTHSNSGNAVRLTNGAPPGGGDVWWDDVMLVEGKYDGPYIDGTSYGCVWDGTANASTSRGYPPSPSLVRNLLLNPGATTLTLWSTYGGAGTHSTATMERVSAPWSRSGYAMRLTSISTTAGDRAEISPQRGQLIRTDATGVATVSFWAQASRQRATGYVRFRRSGGGGGDTNFTLTDAQQIGTTLKRVVVTATGLAPNADFAVTYRESSASNLFSAGEWLEFSMFMVTHGTYTGEYSDGDTPGWKWEGTAGASASVGYPYTLEGAAGGATPIYSGTNVAPGTLVTFSPPTPHYTIYSIQKDAAYQGADGFWQTNSTGDGARAARMMSTAAGTMTPAVFQVTTQNALASFSVSTDTTARHLYAMSVSQLPTLSYRAIVDNGVLNFANRTEVGTSGIASLYIGRRDGTTNTDLTTEAIVGFAGYHDEATMRAVTKWLANKYGVPLT